jgi:hypothetical protein
VKENGQNVRIAILDYFKSQNCKITDQTIS